MNDRELLELAAKAAGLSVIFSDDGLPCEPYIVTQAGTWSEGWNPLENDGDALRLAVKLRIDLSLWINLGSVTAITHIGAGRGIALSGDSDRPINAHTEPREMDDYTATRRAIVRAAAEIGKAMK